MENLRISSGDFDIDKFLGGGFENDVITTFYGSGGSGKSNFCMMVCVSVARAGGKVVFIDTEGGFSIDRFKQIHRGETNEVKDSLGCIFLLKPVDFKEQEKAFDSLSKYLKKEDVSLVVVDSIAMLYRLELGAAIDSGDSEKIRFVNRKLASQLRALNEIARKKKIPVIVTNQVYSNFSKDDDKERKFSMVGGDLLKYWSKCLIELQNLGGRRKFILRKHRSLPNKEFYFDIVNAGIRKRGLF
jgi:DNA repair protein RadB